MSGEKGKLHQLIAVEGDLDSTNNKVMEEAKLTFTKRAEHFKGQERSYEAFREGDQETPDEKFDTEVVPITTTVHDKLGYVSEHFIRYLDAYVQKEATNQIAVADVVIDGNTLFKNMPATALLGLEKRLRKLREMYELIPTLAPGVEWVPDNDKGEHIYKSKNPKEKAKTKKEPQSKVLVPPFVKDGVGIPAHVEKWDDTITIGKYITVEFSSMLTPADKSKLLGRIDKLSRAVKKARQTANEANIVEIAVGSEILKFIHE